MTERVRMSVMHVDARTDLPVLYTYEPAGGVFATMGYVRLGAMTLWAGADHFGADTDEERDAFLFKILVSLGLPAPKALRVVRAADHMDPSDTGATGHGRNVTELRSSNGVGNGSAVVSPGQRRATPGAAVGLLAGSVIGGLIDGWPTGLIFAFIGISVFPDLFMACWHLVNWRDPRNPSLVPDTVAALSLAVGTVVGGVLGYFTGGDNLDRAMRAFLGMAVTALLLALIAMSYSRVPLRRRAMTWAGPVVVGTFSTVAYAAWRSPVALAIGIVLGIKAAATVAWRFFPPDR